MSVVATNCSRQPPSMDCRLAACAARPGNSSAALALRSPGCNVQTIGRSSDILPPTSEVWTAVTLRGGLPVISHRTHARPRGNRHEQQAPKTHDKRFVRLTQRGESRLRLRRTIEMNTGILELPVQLFQVLWSQASGGNVRAGTKDLREIDRRVSCHGERDVGLPGRQTFDSCDDER